MLVTAAHHSPGARLEFLHRYSGLCWRATLNCKRFPFHDLLWHLDMGLSVLDVIDGGRWQRALFTTYALSLSFFESILLRSLRRVGCQETWVITDVQGYRDSLIERRSQGVGQEFRLVPVSLKEGVFHPKCIYLVGEQLDVLLVGSGNLTFGDYG